MRTETFGSLRVRITGGSDREGGGEGPLVVLLHGFGAPGTDLVPLWRVLDVPRETRFAFPEAPLVLAEMGGFDSRAWFMIDTAALERAMMRGETRDMSDRVPDGLPEARGQLAECLDGLVDALKPPPEGLILGGFSQGSMMALDHALHFDRKLAGVVIWSGTLLAKDEWVPRMASRSGLPVLQSHGRSDPLLSFELAERLRDHLVEAGWEHTFEPFRGAHEIPSPVLRSFESFVARTLAPE
ncbi:MAG: dienelactone hydrolase family protein [Myxococcota bacterium]